MVLIVQSLKIYNTLEGNKEDFIPLDKSHVKIYACGPTVYNYAHIGNARMAVVFDTLVRVLRYSYPKVTYVSNITDIDDKIIDAAKELNVSIGDITQKYTNIYNEDMSKLSVFIVCMFLRASLIGTIFFQLSHFALSSLILSKFIS